MGRKLGGGCPRPVMHNGVVYSSVKEACIKEDMHSTAAWFCIKNNLDGWKYVDEKVMCDEIFIDHPKISGISCSNKGRIKRRNGTITKGNIRPQGYRYFTDYRTGKCHSVHRMIYEAWCGNIQGVIHHIDSCKDNNDISNLMDCSQSENLLYR